MAGHEWLIGWIATLLGSIYAFRVYMLDRKDARKVILWEDIHEGLSALKEQHIQIQRGINDYMPLAAAHAEALLEHHKQLKRLQDQVSSITLGRK